MDKYIFEWEDTDKQTYSNIITIPFECDDIDKFIYDSLNQIDSCDYYTMILNVHVRKKDKHLFESAIMTFEDWFDKNKKIIHAYNR